VEMLTPEERYRRDTEFKALVDLIYSWIVRCRYTPTEVREAAMLAAVHYAMLQVEPRTLRAPSSDSGCPDSVDRRRDDV